MKRAARVTTVLITVVGAAVLSWTVVVWQWKDPFTSLYTRLEQRELASEYDERLASFPPVRHLAATADVRARRLALEARRYRMRVKRGDAIARMTIPRLGVDMIVVNGTDAGSLRKGPGRDERTSMPGEGELVYVAGHRTTYLAPFADIDLLRPGDRVTVEVPYGVFHYEVTRHVVVPATDLGRLRSPGRELLALQACYPRFSDTHRYIAYARLVAVAPRPS